MENKEFTFSWMNHSFSQLLSAFQPYKAYSGSFKKSSTKS